MDKSFTTFEIAKMLQIERNLLAQWLMRGYISPSIQRAQGPGSKNLFSLQDLYKICLFQQLVDSGIRRDEAKFYTDVNFRSIGDGKENRKFAVITRKSKKSGRDVGLIADIRLEKYAPKIVFEDNDSFIVVINLLGIKRRVDRMTEL